MMRRIVLTAFGVLVLFGAGVLVGANKFGQPKSIVHVVTVRWTADSTEQQRQAAIEGVKKMAAEIPGIRNVWTKTLKVQGEGFNNAFVMEFADEKAFKGYDDHPAHRDWEKIYIPIRDRSASHDITN
jgi:hypothetical protein